MRLYPLDPLSILAMMAGMSRPLDRHDFPHGTIPDRAGLFVPGTGEMRRFSNVALVSATIASGADMWNTNLVTTKQLHPLGSLAMTKDGRLFRYGSAGATDLVIGNIVQSAAPIGNHLALTSAVQAVGDGVVGKPIAVTPAGTGGAANLYAEGTLMVDTTPGNGYTHRISGHPAITASVLFNLLLDPDDTVQLAWSTATRYGLHHNPYKTVIQCPTTVTALAVGGVNVIITGNSVAENYGWLQTRGPFAALMNGTPAVGAGLVTSVTTAGALDVCGAVALEINYRILGRMMQLGVSTKNNAVFLQID